jgi:membrane-associated phospholipid phosphatase
MSDSARRPHLRSAAIWGFAVLVVFWVVYGGTDYLAAGRVLRRVHFDWELGVPFVPAMTLFYLSMYGLFLLAPFLLRSEQQLRALAYALSAAVLAAGIGFLLWPAVPAYPNPENLGRWTGLFQFADQLNLRHNMIPSLHVALSVATVAILSHDCNRPLAACLWSWGILISLSTLLTHQHHLLDVATGAALGVAVDRMVYRRLALTPVSNRTELSIPPVLQPRLSIAVERPSGQILLSSVATDQTPSV